MSTPAPEPVTVIGAGPAGSLAALAALREGSSVTIHEKSRFPRHKVCGEFLSPAIAPLLEELGLGAELAAARPARLTHARLCFGRREKRFRLPETALSLSRWTLDQLLLDAVRTRGGELEIGRRRPVPERDAGLVVAHGRSASAGHGVRLFGFKAHHRAAASEPTGDAVELFFFGGGYVGVSPVEGGAINVCGLAPEPALRACRFQPEQLFPEILRARLEGLQRSFDWLLTGPLVFQRELRTGEGCHAGDALGFVDPFTGSGILSAMLTGRLAGQAASRRMPASEYDAGCRRILRRQFRVASTLRGMLGNGLTLALARWIPGALLYRLTRPGV